MSSTQQGIFRPASQAPARTGRGFVYIATIVFCSLLLAVLHLELLSSAKQQGVCCFDDASFAVLSKNVAAGEGYLLTLDYGNADHSGIQFHPALGTGPTTILVGAAAIALVGPTDWAPGVATIVFNAALLATLLVVLSGRVGLARATCYVTVLMFSSVLATLNHHEQWYALLGEVQSFLLTIVAYALIAYGKRSTWTLFIAGAMLGLAFLAKELAILYTLPVAVLMLAKSLRNGSCKIGQRIKKSLLPLLIVAIGASLPVILFELYRMHSLGAQGWILNWKMHIEFIRSQGLAQQDQAFAVQFAERIHLFSARFEIGFAATVVVAVAGVISTLALSKDGYAKRFAILIGGAWALHAAYWLFMSVGWPRYAFLSVPFAIAAASIPILHVPRRGLVAAQWALPAFLLAAFVQPARHYVVDVLYPTLSIAADKSKPAPDPKAELREFLIHRQGVLYAPWWAHVASMEYLLPGKAHFTAVTASSTDEGLLLIDEKLTLPETADFTKLQRRCKPFRSIGNRYRLEECIAAE